MQKDEIKRLIARCSADLVANQQVVGLGSGSTATFFIQELGKRVDKGLRIKAVASSIESQKVAARVKIPLIDIDNVNEIDITFDGADAINEKREMIKGRGGALLREKIIAYASKQYVIMIEEHKWVENFHKILLPIEVVTFGRHLIQKRIEELGYQGQWRKDAQEKLFVTDNGNHIFDVTLSQNFSTEDNDRIKGLVGVVETGFFPFMKQKFVIGTKEGKVEIKS